MALNKSSILAFVLRELGYGEQIIADLGALVGKNAPLAEAVISAVLQAANVDLQAFSSDLPVTGPPIPVSIQGHAYTLVLQFTPVPPPAGGKAAVEDVPSTPVPPSPTLGLAHVQLPPASVEPIDQEADAQIPA